VKLGAKEAAPLMEQAFAADRVEYIVMGDWEDVQVRLGLKTPEAVMPSTTQEMTFPQVSSKPRHERGAAHKKTKSKMAKQSRKKNRKR